MTARVAPEMGRIYHGDCLAFMKTWPDQCFDLVLTDPPYGIEADTKPVRGIQRYDVLGEAGAGWDSDRPSREVFDEIRRISKAQIIWGGNYFADFLPASMGWLVWDKGQRNFSLADGELAWTSYDRAMRIFTYPRAAAMKDGKEHPTQKPLDLIAWCLQKIEAGGGVFRVRSLSGLGDHRARLREDGPLLGWDRTREEVRRGRAAPHRRRAVAGEALLA